MTASVLLGVGRDEGIAVLLALTTNVERMAAWRHRGRHDGKESLCARAADGESDGDGGWRVGDD
jgi:hypothetical protein